MQTSLDGFVPTGPNDEQTWDTWDLDGIKQSVLDLHDQTDTILIGRKLAVDYVSFWLDTGTKPNDPMYELLKELLMLDYNKERPHKALGYRAPSDIFEAIH